MIYLDSSIYSQLTSLQGLLLYRKIRTLELSSPLDNFAYLSLRLYSLNLLQHTLPARVKIPRIARHHDELVRVQRGVIFRSRHADGRETKSVAGLCRHSCRTRILVRGHIDNLLSSVSKITWQTPRFSPMFGVWSRLAPRSKPRTKCCLIITFALLFFPRNTPESNAEFFAHGTKW